MRIIFLLLVASVLAGAQKPALQKDRQVLKDFRKDTVVAPRNIPLATQRTVLSKVFRRYLTDESKCSSDFDMTNGPDPLAAARKAGQIVPSIIDSVTGSFTGAGESQTAYVIFVAECHASHADNFGTKRVAIFQGPRLIADLDVDFKRDIVRKTDLNSDGVDELLMTSGDMNQGTVIEMAALVSFESGRFRVLHDFGTVVEDNCASGRPDSTSTASVLYISDVIPGNMPKLTMENYESGCGQRKRWRLVSTGKRQD
ncbi:MAG TPA: hypothetical protein VFY67_14105 [Pyrinomonadaceae bacterium]|nr:hypothetical protein [Pyrinomonadaceae bacterium]